MARTLGHWNINIRHSGSASIEVITTKKEPVVKDGFIHIHYCEGGVVHQVGYSLASISEYRFSPVYEEVGHGKSNRFNHC